MKRTITILSVLLLLGPGHGLWLYSFAGGTEEGRTLVMFWNLENFFDWRRDSLSGSVSDEEFSSFGDRHWTKKRFMAKCHAVSKSVFYVKDSEGDFPDLIGVAEVENRFVLERLLEDTPLYRTDYRIVHFDSPDPRGIDVGLLYRSSHLKLLRARPLRVGGGCDSPLRTRDILLAEFLMRDGDSIAFLVNHHPSKYGGKTVDRREVALRRLREATDSLQDAGIMNIVAMGDFNDTPQNPSFRILTDEYSRGLRNLAAPLAERGEGTIRYSGKWEMIDMFFISEGLAAGEDIPEMKVLRLPFLMTLDSAHSGEKPLRTYSGLRYIGGVSDHCPIVMRIG